jgi:uncharacterized coiled-coil protein SlyX
MTDYTDLIARLRSWRLPAADKAADVLEAQARRIAELEEARDKAISFVKKQTDDKIDLYDAQYYMRQRIAELEEARAAQGKWINVLDAEIADYIARILKLEAALKPFDEMLQRDFSFMANDERYDDDFTAKVLMRLGDLRAARAALEKKND